tara:strand:- start:624 stop:1046 length:423 start_codon:yes stop_codon:yes gene_type:complete
MKNIFLTLFLLIPFFCISQKDYSNVKERAFNQLGQIEYATLKLLIPAEKKSFDNKRNAKPVSKEASLKQALTSETGSFQLFLDFGTEFKTDANMKIYKRLNSYNNIVDVLNLMGSSGWNLFYVDENEILEGKLVTYYFKK